MSRSLLLTAALALLASCARADDDPLVDFIRTAAAESNTGLEIEFVASALPAGVAGRTEAVRERIRRAAGAAGSAVRVVETDVDLGRGLEPALERRLVEAGVRILTRRRSLGGEVYQWPYLAHLAVRTEHGAGSIELAGSVDADLVRLLGRAALGWRPRIGVVVAGLDAAAVRAGLQRMAGPGIDWIDVDPANPDVAWLDAVAVCASGPLSPEALAFAGERLAGRGSVALFLEGASGLEADLAGRGLVLPSSIVLVPGEGAPSLVVGSDGRLEERREARTARFDGLSGCGPVRVQGTTLRVVDSVPLPHGATFDPSLEPEPAWSLAVLVEAGGSVLVARDADFLVEETGSILAPLVARFVWDARRLTEALPRKRFLSAPIAPREVERLRVADLAIVARGADWVIDDPVRPLLADAPRVERLLASLAEPRRGEPVPDPGAAPVRIERRGRDAILAIDLVAADPATAWADRRPFDFEADRPRTIRLAHAALGRIGSTWHVGRFEPDDDGALRFIPADEADPRRVEALLRALGQAADQVGIVPSDPTVDAPVAIAFESGRVAFLRIAGDVVQVPRGDLAVAYRLGEDAGRLLGADVESLRLQRGPRFVYLHQVVFPTAEEAASFLAQVRAGADFDRLAARTAKDPFTVDLGRIGRGDLLPEIERAAFALEVGAVSEPVATKFGWHVLERTE